MHAIRSRLLPIAVLAGLAAPASAQLIGPNPGIIFVSPLESQAPADPTPIKSAEERRAERATAARIAQLEPLRARADYARELVAGAASAASATTRIARLEQAVSRAESVRRRLDVLRDRYEDDAEFRRQADDFAFSIRKDLARSKRKLSAARPPGTP